VMPMCSMGLNIKNKNCIKVTFDALIQYMFSIYFSYVKVRGKLLLRINFNAVFNLLIKG
jgi:hypothetical protein